MRAEIIAGIPNFKTIDQFISFFIKNHLKILFTKWTTPVNVIANSVGKNTSNIGVRSVPSPNPEKKVRIAIKQANMEIKNTSTICLRYKNKDIKKPS